MNWLQKISAMSISEALETLQFPLGSSPNFSEIQTRWKQLIKQHHPDRGGDEGIAKQVNEARDVLRNSYSPGMNQPRSRYTRDWGNYSSPRPGGGIPDWQTDERSTYNEVGRDRTNVNYAKKEIYDFSKERGSVVPITLWAFDGQFSRGVFTAKTNEESLGFAGEVMEHWNSKGANPYKTVAVFASLPGENRVKLIRLRGEDVSDQNIWFDHESFNSNPFNDRNFEQRVRQL